MSITSVMAGCAAAIAVSVAAAASADPVDNDCANDISATVCKNDGNSSAFAEPEGGSSDGINDCTDVDVISATVCQNDGDSSVFAGPDE